MDNQPQAQHQQVPPQADSAPQQTAPQPLQGSPEQQPQVRSKEDARRNEKSGRFGQAALDEKRAAAIAALRSERGVAEVSPTGVPEVLSTQTQAAQVHAIPNDPNYAVQGLSNNQIKEILGQYDARIAQEAALKAQNTTIAAQIAAQKAEAEAKLARIEGAKGDPLQFLAEAGITDSEWQNMLRGGGELSPEQKEIKALKDQMASFMKQTEEKERAQTRAQAHAEAKQFISANPLTRRMATPDAVLAKQSELSQKWGKPASLADAAADLTASYKQGITNLLQDPEIAAMFNLSVPKPQSNPAVNSPTTLGSKLASSTTPSSGKPGPNDWAGKKALFLQHVANLKRTS